MTQRNCPPGLTHPDTVQQEQRLLEQTVAAHVPLFPKRSGSDTGAPFRSSNVSSLWWLGNIVGLTDNGPVSVLLTYCWSDWQRSVSVLSTYFWSGWRRSCLGPFDVSIFGLADDGLAFDVTIVGLIWLTTVLSQSFQRFYCWSGWRRGPVSVLSTFLFLVWLTTVLPQSFQR